MSGRTYDLIVMVVFAGRIQVILGLIPNGADPIYGGVVFLFFFPEKDISGVHTLIAQVLV